VLITAAAVSYQEGLRRRGGTEGRGWGAQAALTERSVRGWVLGGEEGGGGMGGQGDFVCWSLGAYGPTTGGKGPFSTQHMPSLSQAGHLSHISRLLRRHIGNVSKCGLFSSFLFLQIKGFCSKN